MSAEPPCWAKVDAGVVQAPVQAAGCQRSLAFGVLVKHRPATQSGAGPKKPAVAVPSQRWKLLGECLTARTPTAKPLSFKSVPPSTTASPRSVRPRQCALHEAEGGQGQLALRQIAATKPCSDTLSSCQRSSRCRSEQGLRSFPAGRKTLRPHRLTPDLSTRALTILGPDTPHRS